MGWPPLSTPQCSRQDRLVLECTPGHPSLARATTTFYFNGSPVRRGQSENFLHFSMSDVSPDTNSLNVSCSTDIDHHRFQSPEISIDIEEYVNSSVILDLDVLFRIFIVIILSISI